MNYEIKALKISSVRRTVTLSEEHVAEYKEALRFFKLGENLTKEELTAMMHEADLDGDGKIDFDEFVVMMRNK